MCVLKYVCFKICVFYKTHQQFFHTNQKNTPTNFSHQQKKHTNNFSSTNKTFFTPKQNVGFTPKQLWAGGAQPMGEPSPFNNKMQ